MFKTRIIDIPGAGVTNCNRHNVIRWDQGGVYSTDCNKNVVAYNIIPEWPDQPSATYYDYTQFGMPTTNAASAKRFMFSSEEWFAPYGLYLYLYRAYSPALARFLTRDPIEEKGGVNLYNFGHNNPVARWDALGLIEPISTTLIALGAIWLLSGCSDSDSQSCSQDEKCRVIIREDHCNETTNNDLIRYVQETSSPYTALGIIGCFSYQAKRATDLERKKNGLPAINWIYPQNGSYGLAKDEVGMRPSDGTSFIGELRDANKQLAIEKAKSMCNDSTLCCPRVKIVLQIAEYSNIIPLSSINETIVEVIECNR